MKVLVRKVCPVCNCGFFTPSTPVEMDSKEFDRLLAENPSYDHGVQKASGFRILYTGYAEEACPFCEKAAKKKAEAEKAAKAYAEAERAKLAYVYEHVCGGSDASGGGCGAPLGFRRAATKAEFDSMPGRVWGEAKEHPRWEVPEWVVELEDLGYLRLKLKFRPCRVCRQTF